MIETPKIINADSIVAKPVIMLSVDDYDKLKQKEKMLRELLDCIDLEVIDLVDLMNSEDFKSKFDKNTRVNHCNKVSINVCRLDKITGQEWEKYINNHIEE